MRLNKVIALYTGLGRRTADAAISAGRISVNGVTAKLGQEVTSKDTITLDGRELHPSSEQGELTTIMLNKPVGYVVSRNGQGSRTVYDLLPPEYQHLKPVGRLDKNSSGLLLLTNDGNLANELAHPSRQKVKIYEVTLDRPLQPLHRQMISDYGVLLDDGPSKFQLEPLDETDRSAWRITMHEGRNRQIRRTFKAIGYTVKNLHRTKFGQFSLGNLATGALEEVHRND